MLVTGSDAASQAAEAYRSLRTAIRQKRVGREGEGAVLMIASPQAKEGKTTTVANLAVSYAQDGKRTVLIDCNLRQPGVHELFQLRGGAGLSHYLQGRSQLNDIIHAGGYPGLDIVPGGSVPDNPSELLGSPRMAGLLEQLKAMYDVILFDSPPALEYTDAPLLAEQSDGIVLVIRKGFTKRAVARKARERLEQSGARLLGIVLNR